MLKGTMEIAGTGSKWIQYMEISGIILIVAAVACQTLQLRRFLQGK